MNFVHCIQTHIISVYTTIKLLILETLVTSMLPRHYHQQLQQHLVDQLMTWSSYQSIQELHPHRHQRLTRGLCWMGQQNIYIKKQCEKRRREMKFD